MAARFRYEKILNLKEENEQQKKNALGIAMHKKEQLLAERQLLSDSKDDYLGQKSQKLTQGVNVSDFQYFKNSEAWFKDEEQRLLRAIRQADLDIIQARVALVEATQEKKKFEKLKERAIEETKQEEAYAESQLVDQIVTYNAGIKTKGGAQ